jgi:hypothetical protein
MKNEEKSEGDRQSITGGAICLPYSLEFFSQA